MIIFSSVTKQFLPEEFAIKDVSFEIDSGELVLLTGPSGSGKTTIMKLLIREYQPSAGEITFHDTNLNTIKNSQIPQHRRKIGVVFQDYNLIPELNVWENIALPLSIIGKKEHEIEQRVTDLLGLVSLTDKALHFPKQLSGGEAQRISIARALSTGPSIIFADEPTGNLDQDNSLQIARLLGKINSLGTTVIFATHDHDVIDLFDEQRHIILTNGEIKSDSGEKKNTEKTKESQKKSESTKESKEQKEKTSEKSPKTVDDSKASQTDKKKEEKNEDDQDKSSKEVTEQTKKEEVTSKDKPKKSFFARLFKSNKPKKISLQKIDQVTTDSDKNSDSDTTSNAKTDSSSNSDTEKVEESAKDSNKKVVEDEPTKETKDNKETEKKETTKKSKSKNKKNTKKSK